MKKSFILFFVIGLLFLFNISSDYESQFLLSNSLYGQELNVSNYLNNLPEDLKIDNTTTQVYLMTADYYNRDIYGNFQSKIRVIGEYTRGLEDGFVKWNNVYIAKSDNQEGEFPKGEKQNYMENIRYIPSDKMLKESSFENFPSNPDNVFARNLIWDMMSIEEFAWQYFDSLHLNKPYNVTDIIGQIQMSDVGNYQHSNIQVCWIGISMINNELCAIIEYSALDNIIELNMNEMETKGSEHYWGKTWVSLEDKQIEYAVMYSSTIQEINIKGMPQNITIKTTRELKVEKIK
jgi:hypothetical protein